MKILITGAAVLLDLADYYVKKLLFMELIIFQIIMKKS